MLENLRWGVTRLDEEGKVVVVIDHASFFIPGSLDLLIPA